MFVMKPPKLRLSPLRGAGAEPGRSFDGNCVLLLSVLWEAAFEQPQRLPREFFLQPTVPFRPECLTRLLVNLLWFSRNYFNMALLVLIVFTLLNPLYAFIVAGSGAIHFMKRRFPRRTPTNTGEVPHRAPVLEKRRWTIVEVLLVCLHVVCCVLVGYARGVLPLIVLVLTITVPIIAHAFFTPYTDEAFELYCALLRRNGLPLPRPHSPTRGFCHFGSLRSGPSSEWSTSLLVSPRQRNDVRRMPPKRSSSAVQLSTFSEDDACASPRQRKKSFSSRTRTAHDVLETRACKFAASSCQNIKRRGENGARVENLGVLPGSLEGDGAGDVASTPPNTGGGELTTLSGSLGNDDEEEGDYNNTEEKSG